MSVYVYIYVYYFDQKVLRILPLKSSTINIIYKRLSNIFMTSMNNWQKSGKYFILSSGNEFVYYQIRIFALLISWNDECYRAKDMHYFFCDKIYATKHLKCCKQLLKTTVYQNQQYLVGINHSEMVEIYQRWCVIW